MRARVAATGADMGHLRMVLLCGAVAATSTADTATPAFRCVPFARRPGDDPPPQPNATNCMVGCSWNGTDCALQAEFTQLLWEDEFHGAVVSNSSWGVWDYANPSTMPPNRARANALKDMAYSAGAVSVAGGLLKITAQHHAAPLRVGNLSAHYSTGRLQTEHRQSWGPFGRFEARAKVPAAHGENAAVWLMPESAVSGYTEFDIVESLGKNSSVAYGTYHYGEASTASFGAHRSHLLSSGAAFVSEIPLSAGFHIYGQIWTEEGLWWYVDETVYHHFSLPINATRPAVFFILQVSLGSTWAGPIAPADYPAEFLVDVVRVYGRVGTGDA